MTINYDWPNNRKALNGDIQGFVYFNTTDRLLVIAVVFLSVHGIQNFISSRNRWLGEIFAISYLLQQTCFLKFALVPLKSSVD